MKKQIEIRDGRKIMIINIETENKYFSVTGGLWERTSARDEYQEFKYVDGKKYEMISGGCIHETILKYRPDLKILVDLHLSDVGTGTPMHAHANGYYHFKRDRKKGIDYIRAGAIARTNDSFDTIYNRMGPIWAAEAKKARDLINTLC